MMPPPRMVWPPNTLTPSRWAFESRPFLEEPKPFLCAISIASFARLQGPLRLLNLETEKQKFAEKLFLYFLSSLKLLPLTRISLILTSTKFWRCPCIFLYCFLRLSLKTRILSPRPSPTTEARTLAPVRSDSNLPASPLTARMSENSMLPFSWAVVSIFNFSPGETRYCLPPVRMTAYMTRTSSGSHGAGRFLQNRLCCMGAYRSTSVSQPVKPSQSRIDRRA